MQVCSVLTARWAVAGGAGEICSKAEAVPFGGFAATKAGLFFDLWAYFAVADFGFGLLATSDFRFPFPGGPGAGISRRSLGFSPF